MHINELSWDGPPPIDSYGGGGFRISGGFRAGGLLLTPGAMTGWPAAMPFTAEDFAPVLAEADAIDVLLIGTGAEMAFLPEPARRALEDAEIGADVMATGPACRTYNVLLSEGRRVAAALIAI